VVENACAVRGRDDAGHRILMMRQRRSIPHRVETDGSGLLHGEDGAEDGLRRFIAVVGEVVDTVIFRVEVGPVVMGSR